MMIGEEEEEPQPTLRKITIDEIRSEFRLRLLKENATGFAEIAKERALTGAREIQLNKFHIYIHLSEFCV